MVADSMKEHPLLYWHKQGLSVVPLLPNTKISAIQWKPFQHQRPRDEEIAEWVDRWPYANVGIITGYINRLLVVDIDGIPGIISARGIKDVLKGWAVKTPRGNHYYLQMSVDSKISNRAGILPGIDIRANGGYVVGPGSCIGKLYESYISWPGIENLYKIPECINKILHSNLPLNKEFPKNYQNSPIYSPNRYSQVALERECSKVERAMIGQRNQQLNISAYKICKYIINGDINEDIVINQLLHSAKKNGLPTYEAIRTIHSGIKSAKERSNRKK